MEDTRCCPRHSVVNSGKGVKKTENQRTTFSQRILNVIPSITQKTPTPHTAASKLSGCKTGVTKSEATLGKTLSKIVRNALASERCTYLLATSPLFQPKYWVTSSWEQPKSLRVLDNPTRKLCGVSAARNLDSKRCFLNRTLTAEPAKGLFRTDALRSVTLKSILGPVKS